jgi:hypothetical protein
MIDAHEGMNEMVLAMVPAVAVKGHLTVEGPLPREVTGWTLR